jgi:transposase
MGQEIYLSLEEAVIAAIGIEGPCISDIAKRCGVTAAEVADTISRSNAASRKFRQLVDNLKISIMDNGGNLAAVAKSFGVKRRDIERWISDSPELSADMEDEAEAVVDYAVDSLFEKVKEKKQWAIEAVLFKTNRGRKRGFGETPQPTLADQLRSLNIVEADIKLSIRQNILRPLLQEGSADDSVQS